MSKDADTLVLVTGAAGKVGQAFIKRFLDDPQWHGAKVRALCHNRLLKPSRRLEVTQGSIADRAVVARAINGATHVVHLATCKETPEDVMDVTVKGMFWLLEACRQSPCFERFILIGGDAGMGHFVYPHPVPVTEMQMHSAYEGCYALSKVLEEVMLEQYYIQYDFDGTCLRAPWIMEKDDFKFSMSFGDDVFGGPRWGDRVEADKVGEYIQSGAVPLALDIDGQPLKRNFVHVDDLVSAIIIALDHPGAYQELFNICMDEPVDYGAAAAYLSETRHVPSVTIATEFCSTWLDNTKAKFRLGWRPRIDLEKLIDSSWDYQRDPNDPRKIWYPG